MKSERKMSNLRRQVAEIEVKEGKLKYRKEQILGQLMLMEESADAKENVQHNYGAPSIDWDTEGLEEEVRVNNPKDVDDYSWAEAVVYCATNNWDVEAEKLFKLASAFEGIPLNEAVGMLAEEAPDKLKLRPPEGKFFAKESFVFNHPKILALQ